MSKAGLRDGVFTRSNCSCFETLKNFESSLWPLPEVRGEWEKIIKNSKKCVTLLRFRPTAPTVDDKNVSLFFALNDITNCGDTRYLPAYKSVRSIMLIPGPRQPRIIALYFRTFWSPQIEAKKRAERIMLMCNKTWLWITTVIILLPAFSQAFCRGFERVRDKKKDRHFFNFIINLGQLAALKSSTKSDCRSRCLLWIFCRFFFVFGEHQESWPSMSNEGTDCYKPRQEGSQANEIW